MIGEPAFGDAIDEVSPWICLSQCLLKDELTGSDTKPSRKLLGNLLCLRIY